MVPARHTHAYSSLAQGSTNGRRLCGKRGCGDKLSVFIMHNFRDLGINIYREKIWGITLWATLVIYKNQYIILHMPDVGTNCQNKLL
jgi:hypothetical protein